MKVHDVVQGTTEWLYLRAGIPTASEFDRIITPSGEPSKQQDRYLCGLIAERLMGHPRLEFMSNWMERGKMLEANARSAYEFLHDVETTPVGFITNDEETAGASPDSLVGKHGILEIKCPSEEEHVHYLLETGAVYGKYKVQCQSQLFIAERDWTDLISEHPEMPKAEVHIERDEKFLSKLDEHLRAFTQRLAELYADCIKRGWAKPLDRAEPTLQETLRASLEALNS